jgi:ankyrin repeat protein
MNIVSFLCEHFPEMLGYTDAEDSLVLHYAARGGHIEMLKFLIAQGLEPHAKTKNGSTILHLAAYDGNTDMVDYLCHEYPHLVDLLDDTGHSAAHYAAGSGELPLLLTILQHGADSLVRAGNGSTLLMKAAYKGQMDMIKFLCSENPDMVDMTDDSGCNVMHYAACTGFFETIQYAIDLGLDPKSASNDGHTILHVAVFHRQNQLVKKLCETFPYLITMTDSAGKTPEDIAIDNDNHDAQKIFRRFSRSRNVQSQDSVCQAFADDVLCCQDTDLNCRRVLETLTGLLCFCRK